MNRDKARTRVAAALCGSILILASAGVALAYTGQNLAPLAKVSLQQARAIALKARPGKITDQELERERGGSGLRYSFDIRKDGKTYEVGIDAASGAVLENLAEGPNPD
ncbi:MAG: peptidase M4 [Alphaproteobacteria bacterium]|nr:peptidase M4 [Alphaproteobacteria bacterium]